MTLWWGWISHGRLRLGFIKDWIEAGADTAVTVATSAFMITPMTISPNTGTAATITATSTYCSHSTTATTTIAVKTRLAVAVTSDDIALTGVCVAGTASIRDRYSGLNSVCSFGLRFSLAFGDLETSGMLDLPACAALDVVAVIATITREAILGEYVR